MRVVRRASLILSVVLIVAIAVGYLTRSAELDRARDLRLTARAEVAASELASLVDTVSVAAATGRETEVVADTLAAVFPSHGVCVVSAEVTACAGSGAMPPDVTIDDHEAARESEAGDMVHHDARVTANGGRVTIDADGPTLSVIVEVPGQMCVAPFSVVKSLSAQIVLHCTW